MEQLAKVLPKYKENIIVAVVFRKHFEWYVAPKNLWKMDYNKLCRWRNSSNEECDKQWNLREHMQK